MRTTATWIPLPVRIPLGLIFIAHGAQKVLGVWGGRGLSAFLQGEAPIGLRPSWLWLGAAAFSELIGGILVLLGLMTRLGALAIAAVMVVAMFGVHWQGGFFLANRGIEFTLALLGMAIALLIGGGGRVSIDEQLMRR